MPFAQVYTNHTHKPLPLSTLCLATVVDRPSSPALDKSSMFWQVCMLSRFSCVRLFVILWIVAHQAPLCMGFSRQEYWSRLPSPTPGDLPDPGIKPKVLISPSLTGGFFISSATCEALYFLEPSLNIASTHS